MPRKKESQLYHKASGFIWVKEHPTPETSTRFGQNLHSCKLQPSTRKQTNLDFDLVTTKHKKTTKPKLELEKSVISQFCQFVKKEYIPYLSICHFWRALDPSSLDPHIDAERFGTFRDMARNLVLLKFLLCFRFYLWLILSCKTLVDGTWK